VGFAAFLLVLLLAVLVWTLPGRSRDEAGRSEAPTRTGASGTGSDTASSGPAPVWLAWMSGGFPTGFGRAAHDIAGTLATVVVAGDTLWMRESHDANGELVDRPARPYEFPIDAFSVDPSSYAPFLPEADRSRVLDALNGDEAVLGASSAALRRIGPGGTLTFDDRVVEVGAVVPDDEVGWSELLVGRALGTRLGIVDDRYLLALDAGGMTEQRFTEDVGALLPDGTPLRTVPPGGTEFVRVASGVNPPVVMKGVFGEFAAAPRSDDPAILNMSPRWRDAHIQTRDVPLLGSVTCNEALFPTLIGALKDVEAAGLGDELHVYSGCYAARTVARSDTAPPSQHAYGAAIDIDAPENPYGATPTLDPRVVKIFERWGFLWGGDFLIPDGMHFEFGSRP
jgi:hypothetical protein